MIISQIHIEGIKGIRSKDYELRLYPNKPSILVAPNGYGKSSFATAFSSLNQNRLDVKDDDKHMNDPTTLTVLSIQTTDGAVFVANSSHNTISSAFSVHVINSRLQPSYKKRSFGGRTNVSTSLSIQPIILISTIPETKTFTYLYRDYQINFPRSVRKLLYNLSNKLSDPSFVLLMGKMRPDLERLCQIRNETAIDRFLEALSKVVGTKETLIASGFDTTSINHITSVFAIAEELEQALGISHNEAILTSLQLKDVYKNHQHDFGKILNHFEYIDELKEINQLLSYANCTWKGIAATVKERSLCLEFPNANQISNGERDILCFIGSLIEARRKMRKPQCILIIDEIFDYLDDANLIAAQYFLTHLIEQYKQQSKELFPVILTHLDPEFFKTYVFSKMNVEYLEKTEQHTNRYNVNELIKRRRTCFMEDQQSYKTISENYLHYSEDSTSAEAYLSSLNIDAAILRAEDFRNAAFVELQKYKDGQSYDVILVCCGLRLHIEKSAYDQLLPPKKSSFLCENKTNDKLVYASDNGAVIPEVHFLLSIIYNEAMHLDAQCKQLNPISCKLKNKVIRRMICEA